MSGTKVTSKDTISESTGTVLSDSLAGESLSHGGSFASGDATASSQSARGTNTNNYDTSAATTLDAAPDAEARKAAEEWGENAQMNAASRVHGGERGEYDGALGGSGSEAREGKDFGKRAEEFDEVRGGKPHGRNIKEGGFDSDGPNASFNQDIGGKNDPGRLAEQKFQRSNARDAAAGSFEGGRPEDEGGSYDALNREEDA